MNTAAFDKAHSLMKFMGFAGVVAIIATAIAIGRTQQVIDDTSALAKTDQAQIESLSADIKVQQQEMNDVDRRVTRLEDKK